MPNHKSSSEWETSYRTAAKKLDDLSKIPDYTRQQFHQATKLCLDVIAENEEAVKYLSPVCIGYAQERFGMFRDRRGYKEGTEIARRNDENDDLGIADELLALLGKMEDSARVAEENACARARYARDREQVQQRKEAGIERRAEVEERGRIRARSEKEAIPSGAVAKAGGKMVDEQDPPEGSSASNVFERKGDSWHIVYQGRVNFVTDIIGVEYLALLLKDPGKSKTPSELVAAVARSNSSALTPRPGDAARDPVLDKQALDEAKEKLQALRHDRDKAHRDRDGRSELEAQEEIDKLAQRMQKDMNLTAKSKSGRKSRQMPNPIEKQRKSVYKAIVTALTRVERHDKALALHLRKMVQTGGTCVYNGDAGWIVTL